MKSLLVITTIFSTVVFANDMVDLTSWSQVGASANGVWTISSNKDSVFQSINGKPTAFMSTEKYDYRTFKGVIRVEDNGADDDYIGMILGDPTTQFYIFVWKKGATGGVQDGFTLIRFDGAFDNVVNYGWSVFDVESGPNKILAKQTGVGWVHDRNYEFEMQVYADRIVTKIDGQTIFDVTGLTIPKSRFGFYNWSQSHVRYNSIRQLHPPIAKNITLDVSQGSEKTVTGSWTDLNLDDNHTCEIADQPAHGTVVLYPPCNFTYSPDPDLDGEHTFSYRVTDQDGLNTKGIVTANVLSLGTQFVWPSSIVAGKEHVIELNVKAEDSSQFPSPTFRFENLPSWASFRNGDQLILRPDADDVGTYHDLRVFTSNTLYSDQFIAELDVQVIAHPSNIDFLNQTFDIIPSEPILLSSSDTQFVELKIPPLISHERNQVEGLHELIVKAGIDNLSSITIQGVEINPGESESIMVHLDSEGTTLPLHYSSTQIGKSDFEFELPWLDSPSDARYVIQRACNDASSSRCYINLSMDRHFAPNGEVQAIIRTKAGEYTSYSFDADNWQNSSLLSALQQIGSGDILALNINVLNANSRAFIARVSGLLAHLEFGNDIPPGADLAVILYRHGNGVLEQGYGYENQWGVHRVSWILPTFW